MDFPEPGGLVPVSHAANVVAYSFISYYLYKKVKKLGGFRNNV